MRIGELAVRAAVNIQTVRYYERRGILGTPRRTENGHRIYDAESVRVLQFIKRAQALGFSLAEITGLLRLRRLTSPRPATQRLAMRRLEDIDSRIAQLTAMRGALAALVDTCRHGLPGACPILEALETGSGKLVPTPAARGGRS